MYPIGNARRQKIADSKREFRRKCVVTYKDQEVGGEEEVLDHVGEEAVHGVGAAVQ